MRRLLAFALFLVLAVPGSTLAVIPEADDTLPAGAEVALWWLDTA